MILVLLALCVAQFGGSGPSGPPKFPPSKVTSTNGWELSISPFDLDGLHGAEYTMRSPRNDQASGAAAWTKSRIFTLRDVVVSDRGWTYGWAIENRSPKREWDESTLHIVALDAAGEIRVDEHLKFTDHNPHTGMVFPVIGALVPMEEWNRLVVRAAPKWPYRVNEIYWIYDLATGKRTVTCEPLPMDDPTLPEPRTKTKRIAFEPVQGAPLLVVQGAKLLWNPSARAYVTTELWVLMDLDGNTVWSLDDGTSFREEHAGQASQLIVQRHDIVTSSKPRRFEVTSYRTSERVGYAVSFDDATKQWSVKEESREKVLLPSW